MFFFFLFLFYISQWANVDPREKESLARPDFNLLELPALLRQDASASLMMGRLQYSMVPSEEDDFYCLRKLFYITDVNVDWRVRLHFIQTNFEMLFYLGDDIIFKNKY